MATAAKTKSRKTKPAQREAVDVREAMDLSQSTVDREACIIRNVKICGRTSPNKHGKSGVSGTDYLPCYHDAARDLYEGKQVNVGHPPKSNPDAERVPPDRNGVLFNVEVRNNETYGDWQLIPSHSMTPTFLDCAENPRLHSQFALSHNAKAYGQVANGRYQITQPESVRSVDVVTRGGCNKSLFESEETTVKTTFRELVENGNDEVKLKLGSLLEEMGDMPMIDPAPDAPASTGWREHFGNLIKELAMDESMAPAELKAKLNAALKILEQEAPDDAPADDVPADDAKKDDDLPKMESREVEELATLRKEKAARNVCESLEYYDATPIQIKAIAGLGTDSERRDLAKQFKAIKAPVKRGAQPHTGTPRNVRESRERETKPTNKKAFLAAIGVAAK